MCPVEEFKGVSATTLLCSEFMKETVLKPARTFESQLYLVEIQALGFFQDQPEISLHFSKA